jgi:hypothetical protein
VSRKISLFLIILLTIFCQSLQAQQTGITQSVDLVVLFEKPQKAAAEEVLHIYPQAKKDLKKVFGWNLSFKTTIVLTNNRERFRQMSGNSLVVAYAIPQKNLMVIDYTRTNTDPLSLATIMKHELCHLALHHRITKTRLPRWLDEGVCQWVSDGIAEIVMSRKRSLLDGAVLSEQLFSIRSLSEDFPQSEDSLLLAYEESKSLVEFITQEFGRGGLLELLNHLAAGDDIEAAVRRSYSVSLEELERRWQSHLRRKTTWFTYLANNLYGFLFFFAALITVGGFVRVLINKKRYRDEPPPEA